MAAIFEHSESIKLAPKPGFVVKTKIVEGQNDHIYSTKVFINICHEPRVPKPPTEFKPETVFPMIVRNEWEIPIIVSLEKRAVDKKGVPSFVYDCCINSECFQWVQVSKDLRMILVEWSLESVEMMHELVLERECTFPKMVSKGELSETEITAEDLKNGLQKKLLELKQNETAGLIEELGGGRYGVEEESVNNDTLPDLTNIGGNRLRPLIEEIDEMSLKDETNKNSISESPKRPSLLSSHDLSLLVPDTKAIKYKFSVKRELRGSQCFFLFESDQLTKKINISYKTDANVEGTSILLENIDPSRLLSKLNRLDIPVPKNFVPYKSFLLEKQKKLYIFCESMN